MDRSAFEVVDEHTEGHVSTFTVVVSETCRFFEGHFPGRPVLPAIGQLALLTDLLRSRASAPLCITGANALRFSQPLLPGDRIEVRLDTSVEERVARFQIERHGVGISRGLLMITPETGR